MPTFHVTCRSTNRKKLVEVNDSSSILEAICVKFSLPDKDSILLQSRYEDDWLDVDMEDLTSLIDGTKLCFSCIQGTAAQTVVTGIMDFMYEPLFDNWTIRHILVLNKLLW